MSKPTIYNNVIFGGQDGKILLSDTKIAFESENWQNQQAKSYITSWRWSEIAKHQFNSKTSKKALLKLVSKADSSKCAVFQLENHEILAQLRGDVTQRMRNAKESSMNSDTSSVVKDRFQSRRPTDASNSTILGSSTNRTMNRRTSRDNDALSSKHNDVLNWVRLESSDSIDFALAKVQEAYQDETKNCVCYNLEGGLHDKSVLVHYRTLLKLISDLLLTTYQSRKWIRIILRFSLVFPFEELEEHRERIDIIKSGYEELKSRVMRPLGLVGRVGHRTRYCCRGNFSSSPPRDNDTCTESGDFTMEITKVDTGTLDLGNFYPCPPPADAIVRLEEVRTNENLTCISLGVNLVHSKEFMDCLADIMSDYFPQKRFKSVSFHGSHDDWKKNGKILVDEWIGCVANRIGVEQKTLYRCAASSMAPEMWNEDFTELKCPGGAFYDYRFDGGR